MSNLVLETFRKVAWEDLIVPIRFTPPYAQLWS